MITDMTDEQVLFWAEEAYSDLFKVSEDDPNSEWHSECFAAAVMLAKEMSKRGLKRKGNI